MAMPAQRTIFRWIHLILSIPILGYIYSPFEKLPDYALQLGVFFFLQWFLPDYGCGKAILCDGSFRKER